VEPVAPPATSFRREAIAVLGVATLLLTVLAVSTLAAHRAAIRRLVDERDAAWAAQLSRLAAEVERGARPETLVRGVPGLLALERQPATPSLGGDPPALPAVEPDPTSPVFSHPLANGQILWATFDGGSLGEEQRRLRWLTPIVLLAVGGSAVILLLYARRVLQPYDRLLRRAREAGYPATPDEIGFLVSTFERAIAEAAQLRRAEGVESDLEALENAVGSSLPTGALLLADDHRVLAANAHARSMLDVAPATTAGARSPQPPGGVESDPPPLPEALRQAIAALRATPDGAAGAPREVVIDGERRLEIALRPLRTARRDAQPVHLVLLADVTEARRDAERQRVDESLRRVGEVAAGMAHELRNGLATIQGYAALVLRRAQGVEAEDLRALTRETEHLERVVGDFLTFARPGHAQREEFDLRDLLRRAVADPALGAEFALAAGDAVVVSADRLLVDRALRNLLRNAAEAQSAAPLPASTHGATGIEVRIERDLDTLAVVIRDRGRGWPSGLRDRLGEPFVSDRPGGVGLGLALAQRVARLHGGELRFLDPDGGGAEVRFVLPSALEIGQTAT
jgi:nitrogen fixation/metabolism regulation signal transduction histidine kinase